jgi:hypothetical protein
VRSAVESTDEAEIFERRLMDNAPLDTWLDADCRVALLGDGGRLFVSCANVVGEIPFVVVINLASVVSLLAIQATGFPETGILSSCEERSNGWNPIGESYRSLKLPKLL